MISLDDFAEGAVAEAFRIELSKVLANIADPNTDANKVRKLSITVAIKADEKRDIAAVQVQTKSTLIPAKPIETKLIMDYDNNGQVIGAELKSGMKGQTYITPDGEIADDKGNVITDNVVSFK
ncbi:replication terminator protein [Brevibacillus laterosporus]|uniref:Replication terminator protein n=1 Tax=Brevibacillus laterosporus TaxID=1465 RepID=A0AAP3DHJ8_BRELA|nr:replication terminator protein [Brevibacillus laterosporus]MCR8980932.1 replication terminator protein [Brevibacillus laterosporus]MCZ0808087.1 replication terminator protein [Brevibacillus laterosporus]MCZ0826279.1 replication terminator protein [Brevibacillus laterosporus]MCZ0850162.1 replication terminator protein [Brevibacillus laterosporus]